MMYPILCKVRYETLHEILSHRGIWKQLGFSVFMNWIVAPFLMVCCHSLVSATKIPSNRTFPPNRHVWLI